MERARTEGCLEPYDRAALRPPGRRRRPSPALRVAVRAGAAACLAAAVAAPLARRRLRIPPAVTLAATAAGPLALAVLTPRTRRRDAALYALQMWAFAHAHEIPYDDPEALRRRLRIHYPIRADRAFGLGELPGVRLQRVLGGVGGVSGLDRALSFVHWAWFFEPHLALLFIQARHLDRFPRAARQMAAVYDLGCAVYFAVPTAPPWWAAREGHLDAELEHVSAAVAAEMGDGAAARSPALRRVMVDVGEQVWGGTWDRLYDSLGGNPWAAMPSLHFATSLMAALLLGELGPIAGAVGWSYAVALGFALLYLGEHYLTDLLAGGALVAAVRHGEPLAEPVVLALNAGLRRLERVAG